MSKISIHRDQYYAETWYFEYEDTGLPFDLTDHTVLFTVKKNKFDDDEAAVILKDWTSHTDPTNGETSPLLDADTSADGTDKAEGEYWFGITVKDASSRPVLVFTGEFEILPNLTDR